MRQLQYMDMEWSEMVDDVGPRIVLNLRGEVVSTVNQGHFLSVRNVSR